MQVAATTSQPATTTATPPQQQLDGKTFMTLLVAQLQSQDPFQPMDPTAMVGQLVQFNTLDQITQIRQDIEKQQSSGTSAASIGSPASSGANTNPSNVSSNPL